MKPLGLLSVALAFAATAAPVAHSQVARVSAVQRTAEKRSAGAGWVAAAAGTVLAAGDAFRTGKRSRADVNFNDGSLLRLGQLCSLRFTDASSAHLSSGQLLFSRLTPGRIVAGAAAAEIKGSVGIITLLDNGAAEFSLFSGAMNVVSPRSTVPLAPGHWVTVYRDGSFSPVKVAPPLNFAFGQSSPQLIEPPLDVPFAGSQEQVRQRSMPERLTLDQYNSQLVPLQAIPFDPLPGRQLTRTAGSSTEARTASSPDAAVDHLNDIDHSLGHFSGGDVMLADIIGANGRGAYGGRLHGFATSGHWYLDGAFLPLRARGNTGAGRATVDETAITSLEAIYRGPRGDLEVGRQRFLQGPSEATAFGSLVRAGAREIMDAVRVRPRLRNGSRLEVAYLQDAYVRNLPYRVPGSQKGWYGRYGLERSAFNAGLNLLRYRDVPGAFATGWSIDGALPVVRHEVELYGETGRDPFRRRLMTAGLAFPGLARRADLEAFLEYSHLGDGTVAQSEPSQLALRVYRHLNRNMYWMGDISHFGNGHTGFTFGIALGRSSYADR